jgi:hypothetical protein
MMKLFKLGVCIAWGAVAVSSATPASAYALTYQSGAYAACSANYSSGFFSDGVCSGAEFNYEQTIKFVSTTCNAGGGCTDQMGVTYTDFVYPTGRKATSLDVDCSEAGYRTYGLGTCAC